MLNEKQINERRYLVTASDLPIICGLSPYLTPWELWARKTGLVPNTPPTLQMDLGSALEEPIQRVANKHWNLGIIPNALDVLVHHPIVSWAAATPDGHIDGENKINEVKLVGKGQDWRDGVPPYVVAQIQWQMECCQAESCIVLALVWSRLKMYEVEYSSDIINAMMPRAEEFHEYLISNEAPPGEPPPPVEIPKQKSDTIIEINVEDNLFSEVDTYAKVRQEMAEHKKAKDAYETKIKHRIGEYGGVRCGRYLATWYADKNGKRRFSFKEEL